jgi:PAS domain S-box-containing protein
MASEKDRNDNLIDKIIGLGERSTRKTYYPELQKRMDELERFRALLDQTHDLIFVISSPDCVFVDLNGSAARYLGFGREELLGRAVEEVFTATVAIEIRRAVCAPDAGGEKTTLSGRMLRKDGSNFPAEVTLSAVLFGDAVYGVAVCRDITDREKAEEAALREEVLARLNKELDQRVKERTKELARANDLLQKMGAHDHKMTYHARLEAERHRDYQIRLKKLLRLCSTILHEETIEGVLQQVVEAAREITRSRYAVCGHGFLNRNFHIDAVSRHQSASPCPPDKEFVIERGGVYLEIIEKVAPIRLTDRELKSHPLWWGMPQGHAELRGLLGAPLTTGEGKARGFIMVSDKVDGSDFSEEDESLLLHLAAVVSLGVRCLCPEPKASSGATEGVLTGCSPPPSGKASS